MGRGLCVVDSAGGGQQRAFCCVERKDENSVPCVNSRNARTPVPCQPGFREGSQIKFEKNKRKAKKQTKGLSVQSSDVCGEPIQEHRKGRLGHSRPWQNCHTSTATSARPTSHLPLRLLRQANTLSERDGPPWALRGEKQQNTSNLGEFRALPVDRVSQVILHLKQVV